MQDTDQLMNTATTTTTTVYKEDIHSVKPYLSYRNLLITLLLFGSLFTGLIVIVKFTSIDFDASHGKLLINRYTHITSTDPCIRRHGYYHHQCINSSTIANIDVASNKTIYRIAIHGDSLVSAPNYLYNFSANILKKISNRIPNLIFDIIVCGETAYNIAHVLLTLDEICLSYHPHSFILYGDSDRRAFEERISDYKSKTYLSNLDKLLHRLKNNGVVFIALAGPGLEGELPNGQNLDDYSAEAYRKANINYAKSHKIPFIDIRKALFKAEEDNKGGEYRYEHGLHGVCGYLTIDGAHPTYLGNTIIEDLIVTQLEKWYKTITN